MTMTLDDLSERKRQVAMLVALGLSYAAIARRLSKRDGSHPSARTIEMHTRQLADAIERGSDVPPRTRVRRWVESQCVA